MRKLLLVLLTLITLSLSSAVTNISLTGDSCNAELTDNSVITFNPVCVVDMGTGNKAPDVDSVPGSLTGAEGATISLVGTAATDTDGSISAYLWEQAEGTTVSLSNAATDTATFTAPVTGSALTFFLYVTDDLNAQNIRVVTFSATDPTSNQSPVANAGVDYSIPESTASVSLYGNASTDSDGNIVTYAWTQTVGTSVSISNNDQAVANYPSPAVSGDEGLTFQLVVTDDDSATDTDTVDVTVTNTPAAGTVYYVSACETGADGDCVAGNDSNDGLSKANAWKTYSKAHGQFSSLSAGDQILFAKGGSFLATSNAIWSNTNSTAVSNVVVNWYVPTWGSGDEARPIITQDNASHIFEINPGWQQPANAGYTFSNLDIRCGAAASASWGFYFWNSTTDVTLDNVSVDSCSIGVHAAAQTDRLHVKNSQFTNNAGDGFLGFGDNMLIEFNTFDANGSGTTTTHNLYLNGSSDGVRIADNTLTDSSWDGSNVCRGTSLVVHGTHSNLTIDNNTVTETSAGEGCYGIAVNAADTTAETFTNITIINNTVNNVGGISIAVSSCVDCFIQNNKVNQNNTGYSVIGIIGPLNVGGAGDADMTNVHIDSNELVFAAGTSGIGIQLNTQGTSHEITNNCIKYNGSGSWDDILDDLPSGDYDDRSGNTTGTGTCP